MVTRKRVQDIRYRLRWHSRSVSGIEDIPAVDVPVSYDPDCPKASDGKAGPGSIRRIVGHHAITQQDKEPEFRAALSAWHEKWRGFLAEKSVGTDGRMHFTHPRPRAAYRSLGFYMPYLWTFEHYPQFCIPNTNAAIESLNQRLKTLLRNHSGISSQRRIKLLEEYIARHY